MDRDETIMVDLLATVRAAVHSTPVAKQMSFAGKVLCFIFDPVKAANPDYQPQVEAFRRAFRGIADSQELKAQFVESLTAKVIAAHALDDVMSQPFSSILREPLTRGDT